MKKKKSLMEDKGTMRCRGPTPVRTPKDTSHKGTRPSQFVVAA